MIHTTSLFNVGPWWARGGPARRIVSGASLFNVTYDFLALVHIRGPLISIFIFQALEPNDAY